MTLSSPATTQTDLPARVVLSSIAIFWCIWVVLMTARAAGIGFTEPLDLLLRRLGVAIIGAAITWAFWQGLRRVTTERPVMMVIVSLTAASPVTIAFAVVNWWIFYGLHPSGSIAADVSRWGIAATFRHVVADTTVSWLFFFFGWARIYLFLRSAHRSARAEQAVLAAELRALRYQLDPHFLFNALNTLSDLVQSGRNDEADAMILDFSGLLRRMLDEGESSTTASLGEEVALQRLYLALEARRFPERLTASFDVPGVLHGRPVPRLILQPLIENAVKHGLASVDHVYIRIKAEDVPGAMRITVSNDASASGGRGGLGIGLGNVRERLRLVYGDRANLDAGLAGSGWTARLTIPHA